MPDQIHTLTCNSVSEALDLIARARESGLKAAYLPHGGIDAHRDTPITHRVPLMGTHVQIQRFLKGE